MLYHSLIVGQKSYIFATLDELRDDGICVARTPAVKDIVGQEMSYHLMEEIAPTPRSRSQRPPQSRSPSSSDIEKEVLKHRNKTVTTPVVGRVAQRLFENIKVAGKLMDEDMHISDDAPRHPSIIHAANPNSVQWLDPVDDHPGFYGSVLVDEVKYSVSSFLLLDKHVLFVSGRRCCHGCTWGRRGYYSCKILQVPALPVDKQTRKRLLVGHYLVRLVCHF
jgi:hypothetical protein